MSAPFYADPYVDAAEQYLKDKAEGVVYFRGVRCVQVDGCTCGAGRWLCMVPHEPGCGLEPA